ncbi:MAG: hypothetical protein ACLTBR_03285 [Anaerostipes sp.]|uniref:hypothetical protein n=1 Tax=Anaerostipes sp. TaxID=1872530 RepID=UPI00399634C5
MGIKNMSKTERRRERLFFNAPMPERKNLKRHVRNAKKRLKKVNFLILIGMLSVILYVVKFAPELWFFGLLEFNLMLLYVSLTILGL